LHPFAVTAAISLEISLPRDLLSARLHVRLVDKSAQCITHNFMDVSVLAR
jgi:hypothetical protein